MNKSFKVFLCSTQSDLVSEREAILEAIRKVQLQHKSMEFFGARTNQPIETCLEEVRQSDILVAIHAVVAAQRQINILLTWNCRHLANPHLLGKLREFMGRHGLTLPEVCTPIELMGG